jgi:hypothetical protein
VITTSRGAWARTGAICPVRPRAAVPATNKVRRLVMKVLLTSASQARAGSAHRGEAAEVWVVQMRAGQRQHVAMSEACADMRRVSQRRKRRRHQYKRASAVTAT